jgi:hypothetical protein
MFQNGNSENGYGYGAPQCLSIRYLNIDRARRNLLVSQDTGMEKILSSRSIAKFQRPRCVLSVWIRLVHITSQQPLASPPHIFCTVGQQSPLGRMDRLEQDPPSSLSYILQA